jgi:hypothetical protein
VGIEARLRGVDLWPRLHQRRARQNSLIRAMAGIADAWRRPIVDSTLSNLKENYSDSLAAKHLKSPPPSRLCLSFLPMMSLAFRRNLAE